jgi:integrase/recombinase XerD
LPEVLSEEEVDMLEGSIDLSKWEGQRNKAIIEVLFSCGLRVSELVNLNLSSI